MATLHLTTTITTTLLSNSFTPKPNIPVLSFPTNASLSFIPCTQNQPIKSRRTHSLKAFDGKRGVNSDEKETIMLPGCDYNHWLIVMEFPKDPAPSREQMIDTYLDTLAQVVGSMEEAKKNMYAFSTTTYTGFQCTVSEETSEKFKGLPGVLWVLPDSYIDVKNKDYGGDKYVNGEIIPCQYPTYQPKQSKGGLKYKSKAYVRQRDGPPAEKAKPKQVTPSAAKQEPPSDSESSSS